MSIWRSRVQIPSAPPFLISHWFVRYQFPPAYIQTNLKEVETQPMSFATNPSEFFGSLGLLSIVILFLLSIFSVVSWGIIVNKFRRFWRIRQEESQFLQLYERNPVDQQTLRNQAQRLAYSPSSAVYLGIIDRLPDILRHFYLPTSTGAPACRTLPQSSVPGKGRSIHHPKSNQSSGSVFTIFGHHRESDSVYWAPGNRVGYYQRLPGNWRARFRKHCRRSPWGF